MELGALVVTRDSPDQPVGHYPGTWSAAWPVVGKTVLERWLKRVQDSGAGMVSVVGRDAQPPSPLRTMVDWASGGVEKILLIVLGSYADIDLMDLVHFHHQARNRVTKVFDRQGPLGISLHDGGAVLKHSKGATPRQAGTAARYDFLGYATRLSSTISYRQLVQDALEGRCDIQPAGDHVGDNVWIDPTAELHPSVRIQSPCYIGAHTRLHAGVTVTGFSSIERNCEIDLGTTVDRSCILPNTRLASGLHVSNSVVDGPRLEHLDRGLIVDLGRAGLSEVRPQDKRQCDATLKSVRQRRWCTGERNFSCSENFTPERPSDAL